MACLIHFTDGENNYLEMPKAGRIQVTGEGILKDISLISLFISSIQYLLCIGNINMK